MTDRAIDIKVNGVKSTATNVSQALQNAEEKDKTFIESYKDKVTATLTQEEITELEAARNRTLEREKLAYKRRIARVLDRGFTVDRLTVPIPPEDGLHGEWIGLTPSDQARASLLGFIDDTKYATNRAINDGGDGTNRVGDVKFMVQPMWMHEAIVEERDRKYAEANLSKKQKEERDFLLRNQEEGVPASANSLAENLSGPELTERMEKNTPSVPVGQTLN